MYIYIYSAIHRGTQLWHFTHILPCNIRFHDWLCRQCVVGALGGSAGELGVQDTRIHHYVWFMCKYVVGFDDRYAVFLPLVTFLHHIISTTPSHSLSHHSNSLSMLSSATHPLPICILELINAIVGVHLFLVLYKEMELEDIRKYRYVFHAIAWGYPLFACLLPLFKDKYPLFSSLFSLLLLSTFTSHPLSLPKFSEITFNV